MLFRFVEFDVGCFYVENLSSEMSARVFGRYSCHSRVTSRFSFSFYKNLRGIVRKAKSASGSKAVYFHAGYSGHGADSSSKILSQIAELSFHSDYAA